MFISFFSVMMVILLLIWGAFNLFSGNYIRNEAIDALSATVDRLIDGGPLLVQPSLSYDRLLENVYRMAWERASVAEVNVAIVDGSYQILRPQENSMLSYEYKQLLDAITTLHDQQGEIATWQNMHVWNNEYSYYVSALPIVPVEASITKEEQYLVLFIDVTRMNTLVSQLNLMLVPIALLALLLAAIMTAVVTNVTVKPIKALSQFASDIGRGVFRTRQIEMKDREMAELLHSMNETVVRLYGYDKEQRDFFQNVSHELRTPLMSIKGYAEGIKYGVFDQNQDAADIIISESNRLTAMVEELLYISRMDNREEKLDYDQNDLRDIVTGCVELLRGITVSSGIEFDFVFDENPVMAYCDETHISKALTNIISNALRYARSRILITCHTEGENAIVSVTDDGPGIDPQQMPRLFDRFYKGSEGKHGIGLAIAKSAVEKHGGKISVQNSSPEGGATFTISIPIADRN